MKADKIIFIVGVGRSGTSLLQSMMASHPEVSSLPEISFLRRIVSKLKIQVRSRNDDLSIVTQFLESDSHMHRTKIDIRDLAKRALTRNENINLAVYKEIVNDTLKNENGWYLDKDPRLIEYLPLIRHFFPQAHIIHIIRDPRDVLSSKKIASWSRNRQGIQHIFANRVQIKLGMEAGFCNFPGKYIELSYEKLIENPEVELSKICNEIELDFNSSMLNFSAAAHSLVTSSEIEWKKETLGALIEGNKNKWRANLSDKEAYLVELCCSDALNVSNSGHSDARNKCTFSEKFWVYSAAILIVLATKPYIFYRNFMVLRSCKLLEK